MRCNWSARHRKDWRGTIVGWATNLFDALGGFAFLQVVLPGSLMRSVIPVSSLFLVGLLSLAPVSRAQEDSDGEKDGEKKHYLTFQLSYRGTASKRVQSEFNRRETTIEVDNRFSGRIEVRPTEAYDLPTNLSAEAQMKRAMAMQAAVLAGDMEKLKQATPDLLVTWFPRGDQVEITGRISEKMTVNATQTEQGESRATSDLLSETYDCDKVFEGDFGNAFVKIRPEEKRYDVQFSLMPDMASTWEAVRQTIVKEHKEEGRNTQSQEEAKVPLDTGTGQWNLGYSNYQIAAEMKGQPLAGEANELLGTASIPVPKPPGWDGSWDIALEVSWQIDITLPPLELVITAPGYDEWRPEGNIKKPTEPGNKLMARATLKPKDGEGKFVPRVKNIRFQLLDTSREPGICLNWPLSAKDQDYDLRLAAVAGGKLSKSDQILEVDDPKRNDEGQAYAEVQIDSYDFGGRASLRAICLLADGREIEGVMKEVGEMPRLPKMKSPGWVADSWKQKNKAASLADDDDNEKVEGQKDNGDGFTLYEEYRGWAENEKHIDGDPKRKDLFILNQIGAGGADAIGGIKLFERVSKLITHHRLSESEMSTAARLMKGNHREAPHRVDQHGVWMYNADGTGVPAGGTVGMTNEDADRAFRPGRVNHVVVESRGIYDAIFGHDRSVGDYKLSERDAAFAYDRAVAHELLHVVGVDHHGEGEDTSTFYFVSASDPNNPSHRAGFSQQLPKVYNLDLRRSPDHVYDGSELMRNELETLIWEDTGRNIAEELAPLYERKLEAERARRAANPPTGEEDAGRRATEFPQYGKSEFSWRETDVFDAVAYNNDEFEVFATICELNGADSGNELCLMRYYFATAYPVKGKTKTYYVVRPGQNRAGRSTCQSPAGTGANAPSHQPQSRFGDSAPKRGNCFGDICPNDAIPPRNLH